MLSIFSKIELSILDRSPKWFFFYFLALYAGLKDHDMDLKDWFVIHGFIPVYNCKHVGIDLKHFLLPSRFYFFHTSYSWLYVLCSSCRHLFYIFCSPSELEDRAIIFHLSNSVVFCDIFDVFFSLFFSAQMTLSVILSLRFSKPHCDSYDEA